MSSVPGAFAMPSCPCCFRPGHLLCEPLGPDGVSQALTPAVKLTALRALMKKHGLDAYLVPSEDAHGSE